MKKNIREIIVRAYDPELKVMAEVMNIDFLGREGLIPTVYLHHRDHGFWTKDMSQVELSQYTGNSYFDYSEGVSIATKVFEGDIVECIYDPAVTTETGWVGVVEFIESLSGFSIRGINGGLYSVAFSGSAVKSKKVIGNKWENPELLVKEVI